MELKAFISQALQDIVGAVDDAQKHIAYGEIVPNRDAKTGEVEIEFEITVKPEGEEDRLVVVATSIGGGAKPPGGGPPGPGSPPPPPHAGKLKFKVPVKLPEEKWYHVFYRLVNEARACFPRRRRKPAQQPAADAKEEARPEDKKEQE